MQQVHELVKELQSNRRHRETIVSTMVNEPRDARYADFPRNLDQRLIRLCKEQGISELYLHQSHAIDAVLSEKNIVITSGVASGKSLCYQLPILSACLADPKSRALLIYPTKALAQDQAQKLKSMIGQLKKYSGTKVISAIYDGDTPTEDRSKIRREANIIFSNPDMLHLGILPNHSLWTNFFSRLRYIVIDEVHYYRGILGSHFANVLRRLQRICRLYRVDPVFICTSATLANSLELVQELIGQDALLISEDGSPQGERINMIVNPPIVDYDLGIRRSSMLESASLAKLIMSYEVSTILFSISRRSVEMLLLHMPEGLRGQISSYRSGYLASERRKIEKDLREGRLRLIITTNALELGIDIGSLDVALINGYPGSISAVRQEAGRAGRKANTALSILVAGSNPLDQYICRHPEYLWEKNPELALIDPNNTEVLLQELRCAISELSLRDTESFGNLEPIELSGYLNVLLDEGKIRKVGNKYLGMTNDYPAAEVSIRNASNQLPIMADGECIGYVDRLSSLWMTHPGAIYLHLGETWIVKALDLEKNIVFLDPIVADYYTQALRDTELLLVNLMQSISYDWGKKHFGRVLVQEQVTGFKRIRFGTMEVLGMEDLNLPMQELETVAWWISLSPELVKRLRDRGLWNGDRNYYGPRWKEISAQIRARDGYHCQRCQAPESGKAWDVHHRVPLRRFPSYEEANDPANLVTLCPRCHKLAEERIRIQGGLSGLGYLLHNLAPFFVMCDPEDLGLSVEAEAGLTDGWPMIALFDKIPGGIGLCQKLYEIQDKLLSAALELIQSCECDDGCPGCVGPVAELGEGAKSHAAAILKELLK
nr:box helicase protein [Candidatus Cloacimonadota bacterium]